MPTAAAPACAVSEGDFTDLKLDDAGSKPTFVTQADGTVRVGIPTKDMMGDLGADRTIRRRPKC